MRGLKVSERAVKSAIRKKAKDLFMKATMQTVVDTSDDGLVEPRVE